MDDITTLINSWALLDDLIKAANNVIIKYDLHFTAKDVIEAIKALRRIFVYSYVERLLRLTLTTNLRMFIAIVYLALNNGAMYKYVRLIVQKGDEHVLGYDMGYHLQYRDNYVRAGVVVYCTLYDYYEFDITNLQIPNDMKVQIQDHIDSKRTYTKPTVKPAIKNEEVMITNAS